MPQQTTHSLFVYGTLRAGEAHWVRLDEFEGDEYRRVLTTVETQRGPVAAWVYEHLR